jgi:diguanylate cyclase (GGDEF)-like protein
LQKLEFRFLAVLLSFAIVSYLAVSFKTQLDSFTEDKKVLYRITHSLERNFQEHLNIVEESIINLYFNNDKLLIAVKKEQSIIHNLCSKPERLQSDYRTFFNNAKKYEEISNELENNTLLFAKVNSKVKNSIHILEMNLKKYGERYSEEYLKIFVEILFEIKRVKNDIYGDKQLDKDLFEKFQKFNDFINKPQDKLNFIHVSLLYYNIPKFKETFLKLKNSQAVPLIQEMREKLHIESEVIKESMQNKFYIMVTSYFLFFILILYLIFHLKKEAKKIEDLRLKNEASLKEDFLTGLQNRSAFLIDVENEEKKKSKSVLLFDIVSFKDINTVIGYEGGDKAILHVTNSIKKFNDEIDSIYRIKGDHFLVVTPLDNTSALENLALRIIHEVEKNVFTYQGLEFVIYLQAGGTTSRPYLKHTEEALQNTKRSFGKFSFYQKDLDQDKEQILKNLDMLNEVKEALKEDRIYPFFQPIVDLQTKEIVKYEALVRLIDKEAKAISPFFFLDLSKKSKLYIDIAEQVLQNSIRLITEKNIEVSINISYSEVVEKRVRNLIVNILENNKAIADKITFEILESDEIQNYNILYEFVNLVRTFGSKVAIDDFGTGYSNFSQLFKLKPDIVKIDGSLIKDIHINEHSRNIVESIVVLARSSGIKTVAEFVENKEIDKIVTELGIDFGQGYLYSPPQNILVRQI